MGCIMVSESYTDAVKLNLVPNVVMVAATRTCRLESGRLAPAIRAPGHLE